MWDSQDQRNAGQFNAGFAVGIICGCMLGAFLAMVFCSSQADQMRLKCVENGAAYYDSKTGAFTWKNETSLSDSAAESR